MDKVENEQSGDTHEVINTSIDDIDLSDIHRAEPYYQFFKKETVKKLFSRKWQYKQEGYEALINEFKLGNEPSGDHANIAAEKKHELLELMLNAVERGLDDKIVQVKLKACDLFKEMLLDQSSKSVDIKDASQVIGILADFLTENNPKVKEKCEDTLKTMLINSKIVFNEGLICILSKGSKMNKNVTRYNHCKLEFLISIFSHPQIAESSDNNSNFPTALFLDFIDKGILMREKVLNRSLREKVERAFIIAYEKSNYETIKDY